MKDNTKDEARSEFEGAFRGLFTPTMVDGICGKTGEEATEFLDDVINVLCGGLCRAASCFLAILPEEQRVNAALFIADELRKAVINGSLEDAKIAVQFIHRTEKE